MNGRGRRRRQVDERGLRYSREVWCGMTSEGWIDVLLGLVGYSQCDCRLTGGLHDQVTSDKIAVSSKECIIYLCPT